MFQLRFCCIFITIFLVYSCSFAPTISNDIYIKFPKGSKLDLFHNFEFNRVYAFENNFFFFVELEDDFSGIPRSHLIITDPCFKVVGAKLLLPKALLNVKNDTINLLGISSHGSLQGRYFRDDIPKKFSINPIISENANDDFESDYSDVGIPMSANYDNIRHDIILSGDSIRIQVPVNNCIFERGNKVSVHMGNNIYKYYSLKSTDEEKKLKLNILQYLGNKQICN